MNYTIEVNAKAVHRKDGGELNNYAIFDIMQEAYYTEKGGYQYTEVNGKRVSGKSHIVERVLCVIANALMREIPSTMRLIGDEQSVYIVIKR